jgi:hypothetical protein
MLDGQDDSAYTFAANDITPAAIINLGRVLPIKRISTFSNSGSARSTFYVFATLPGDNGANPARNIAR